MLQASLIKDHFETYKVGLEKRGLKEGEKMLNQVLDLNEKRKNIQRELDEVLHESNVLAKEIGNLFKQGKKEEAEHAKEKSADLKTASKELSASLTNTEEELKQLLYAIPNIPNELVPAGTSEADNQIIKTEDQAIPSLKESKKPHWDLIEEYDIIDFNLGNKVTGAGFPFYKGAGARINRALINYFLDEGMKAGYHEVQPPIVINADSGYGTGQLPDKEGQMYHMEANGLFMIPTAEVPITNMYRDTIIPHDQLPVKNIGYTPCFRREAGNWGAHVRGLNRLHQFDKVEIVQIATPEKSYSLLDEMVEHVEHLIRSLALPYRLLRLCGGDLGFTSAITYDFEVFSAAQERWLEVSSVSNFETYQANRLKLRIKGEDGKKRLAHTLNGSALALPRIVACILENNQEKDQIKMPEVLHPYLGFDTLKKP